MTWLRGNGWRRSHQPWWLVVVVLLLVLSAGDGPESSGLTPTEQNLVSESPSLPPGDVFFYPAPSVTVPHGHFLVMSLGYFPSWQIMGISNPDVLRQNGAPHIIPVTVSCGPAYKCDPVPVHATLTFIFFRALRPGVAQVSVGTDFDNHALDFTATVTVT